MLTIGEPAPFPFGSVLIISSGHPSGNRASGRFEVLPIPPSDQQAAAIAAVEGAVGGALRRLGARGSGVLVALSGGADSMVLSAICARIAGRLGLRVEASIVDHGLRPESGVEATLVHERAQALGVPAHVRALGLAPGPGAEARAREARYAALEAVRRERGLDFVLTAHTASDQAETLLMRLGRGSALGGAAGVLERRGAVLRPMLAVTRDEVLQVVAGLGLPTVADPMNLDPAFLRVAVRRELVPALVKTLGPSAPGHLARFAALAAEDEALLAGLAARAFERVERDGRLDEIAVGALEPPVRRRVLVRWLEAHGLAVDGPLVLDLIAALAQGRGATLPRDRVLTRDGPWLVIAPAPPRHQ